MAMPNMTGKDLARELMTIRPGMPVILCTGFSEQIDEHKAKAMGISAYVMKPIVMREIANTVREVLDQRDWRLIIEYWELTIDYWQTLNQIERDNPYGNDQGPYTGKINGRYEPFCFSGESEYF